MRIFATFRQWVSFLNSSLYKYRPVYMACRLTQVISVNCVEGTCLLAETKSPLSFSVSFFDHVSVCSIYSLLTLCQLWSGNFSLNLKILGHCHHSPMLSSSFLWLWNRQLMEPRNHTTNSPKWWNEINHLPACCLCQVHDSTYLQTSDSKRCLLKSLKPGTQVLLCLQLCGALESGQGGREKLGNYDSTWFVELKKKSHQILQFNVLLEKK